MKPKTLFRFCSAATFAAGAIFLLSGIARAQFHAGVAGGYAASIAGDGLAGFGDTTLGGTSTRAGSAAYRIGNGLVLGVRAEQLRLHLTETGADMGRLRITPLLVSVGYQGLPANGRGFTGHGQFGGGIALTSFTNGAFVSDLERMTGATMQVRTKSAPAFEAGGGVDYFVTRQISFTTDFRLLLSNVPVSMTAVGPRGSAAVPGVEKFFASSAQVLGGIRLWIR
jgi:hypothetical protein